MHATMAVLECKELTQKINMKKRHKEAEPTVSIAGVQWMTGPVGHVTMDAHDVEVDVKSQKKAGGSVEITSVLLASHLLLLEYFITGFLNLTTHTFNFLSRLDKWIHLI